jgi:hypothetical protein
MSQKAQNRGTEVLLILAAPLQWKPPARYLNFLGTKWISALLASLKS